MFVLHHRKRQDSGTVASSKPTYNIAMLHPDLGVGGAERLVVDMGLALKEVGHRVTMFTSHHDRSHCFDETIDGSLEVVVAGDWLPRSIFGRLQALFAYLRMFYLTLYLLFFGRAEQYDLFIADLVPIGLPCLRARGHKTLFYCHFPDQCLTTRDNWLKVSYRVLIDWIEEYSISFADQVLVNSNFTREVFSKTFTTLSHLSPRVLYPTVKFLDAPGGDGGDEEGGEVLPKSEHLFLSINRYERKKNHELAIYALYDLLHAEKDGTPSTGTTTDDHLHLIIAGGYDRANRENIDYYDELNDLVKRLRLTAHVTLLRSISGELKRQLIARARAIIYTPDNEHFGIVPLEAMYARRPVIAVNSGGPRETIEHGVTGFLCQNEPASFAEAMQALVEQPQLGEQMGEAGHTKVASLFAFERFRNEINKIVDGLANQSKLAAAPPVESN